MPDVRPVDYQEAVVAFLVGVDAYRRVLAVVFLHVQLQLDLQKHNSQYPPIEVHTCKKSHDRFLIIDGTEVWHIGASLKDLGKKMFAFSRLGIPAEAVTGLL